MSLPGVCNVRHSTSAPAAATDITAALKTLTGPPASGLRVETILIILIEVLLRRRYRHRIIFYLHGADEFEDLEFGFQPREGVNFGVGKSGPDHERILSLVRSHVDHAPDVDACEGLGMLSAGRDALRQRRLETRRGHRT